MLARYEKDFSTLYCNKYGVSTLGTKENMNRKK